VLLERGSQVVSSNSEFGRSCTGETCSIDIGWSTGELLCDYTTEYCAIDGPVVQLVLGFFQISEPSFHSRLGSNM
jgi:hypothetical protein